MTIMWCIIPEIWCMTNRIFCHFGRYYHFTHVYHKWWSYDVWLLRNWAQQIELFAILDHFLLFYTLKNPKNQNFQNLKKSPGDTIILHKCTKNHDQMVYCSCNMANLDISRTKHYFYSKWKKSLIAHQGLLYGKKKFCSRGNF